MISNRIILMIWFVLPNALLYSQGINQKYSIEIRSGFGYSPNDFNIKIDGDSRFLNLHFQKVIKIDRTRMNRDKVYKNIMDTISQHQSLPHDFKSIMKDLYSKYTRYKNYDIKVLRKSNVDYFNLLDSIYQSDTNILENTDHNKKRILLDGHPVHIIIISPGTKIKEVYANSPTSSSHPLVFRLIKESLNIYQKTKQKPLIERNYN